MKKYTKDEIQLAIKIYKALEKIETEESIIKHNGDCLPYTCKKCDKINKTPYYKNLKKCTTK